ncbi:MAG: B12-binding domain-containing protein [Phycisphaerae bacterium]
MTIAELFKQYLEHLFAGKRCEARELIFAAQDRGTPAAKLIKSIIWPAMEQIDKLYRENHISRIKEHMATRINRMIADQLHMFLAREPKNGRRIVVSCGDGEGNELGAQMMCDLFEASGYSVWFLGSGVPNDEILQFVGQITPDVLVVYGTNPDGVPDVRRLIDLIREVGVCDDMQILVTGGVFNRAEGLSDEVRADLFAKTAAEAVQTVEDHPVRVPKPDLPQPGRRRKKRKRIGGRPGMKARKVTSGS